MTTSDPSTLAALSPVDSREIHYRTYRASLRLHGSQFMTLKRPSRTPDSGREYVPGDPLQMIDWKAFARTDQLIVREVRDESAARVRVGLDLSTTMRWPRSGEPLAEPPPPKAEIAVRVAFNLAHMHLRMGDLVDIWCVEDEAQGGGVPDRCFRPRSPADLVTAFSRLEAQGFAEGQGLVDFASQRWEPRDVDAAFWVGDALSSADFGGFLAQGRRSMLLHVLSSLETDIGWIQGTTSYFDAGLGVREYQGQVLRQRDNYARRLADWQRELQSRQAQRGGDYLTLTDKTSVAAFHQAVQAFIQERA